MNRFAFLLLPGLLAFTGCDMLYDPTPKPDYTIKVMPSPDGKKTVALPPECPSWNTATTNPYDNQPLPQFGCSNARNLALMVEQPNDLVKGREMDSGSGVLAVGAIRRYYNNQTRGLVDPDTSPDTAVSVTTAPTPSSQMTGDVTGGGSTSSSSSSGAGAAAAAP